MLQNKCSSDFNGQQVPRFSGNSLESLVTNSCGRQMKHRGGGIAERFETPSRLVITEELSQVSGSLAIQNLEIYPTGNWQPTESFEKWVGIIVSAVKS